MSALQFDQDIAHITEGAVAMAKSATLIANAESDIASGAIATAAINGYYGLFHLGIALFWFLPWQAPAQKRQQFLDVRNTGAELPDRDVGHGMIRKFIVDGQMSHKDQLFIDHFKRCLELREFSSYGPRVTYTGNYEALVGPCHYTTTEIRSLVNALADDYSRLIPVAFLEMRKNGPHLHGHDVLERWVFGQAQRYLLESQFPFKDWYPQAVLQRAQEIIVSATKQVAFL